MLEDTIKCIRRHDLGDYSPMMDEIFDSEHAIKLARQFRKQVYPDWPAEEKTQSPKRCRGIIEQLDGGAP